MAANVIFYLSGGEPYRGVAWIGWVQQQPIRPHRSASIYTTVVAVCTVQYVCSAIAR